MAQNSDTPLMKQYYAAKAEYPDAILLFRVGDFYETYGEDAPVAARHLGITLTKRGKGSDNETDMAGFPHHALDTYLPKLVRAGYRVAVCDQLEDPKLTKALVKRGVTELVTPGVSYSDTVLEQKSNNFVAAVHCGKKQVGLSLLDISTGEFLVMEGDDETVAKLLANFQPKELLYERGKAQWAKNLLPGNMARFEMDDWAFMPDAASQRLLKQFDVASLKGFGVSDLPDGIVAAAVILHYLDLTHHDQTSHITHLQRIDEQKYVWMDKFTIRNLELYGPLSGQGLGFVHVLDQTLTPMGGRLLKRWIAFPLRSVEAIKERQQVVEAFFSLKEWREEVLRLLPLVGDMERMLSKLAVGRINPREMVQLAVSMRATQNLLETTRSTGNDFLVASTQGLDACAELYQLMLDQLEDNPPQNVAKGGVFKKGVNADLDKYRQMAYSGKDYLLQMQEQESAATGIPSLKISYNNVFGYYFEVRNMHKDKVPDTWIRKQTLVNAERYITPELKRYEDDILGAEEHVLEIEQQLYAALLQKVATEVARLQACALWVARLDVLSSFATVAKRCAYVCPTLANDGVIDIRQGRHPVIEQQLPDGQSYVANDVYLNNSSQQIMMITGPNMAGKSALLRQTALITLMAQMGSYVPAESAHIGVVDKIFTRVGASDNISMGESTFMVEMNEAASILNNLSNNSLVLFDELGRGTSTYDGISIAWAIVEYLHQTEGKQARTLFATHYHELNEMEKSFKRVVNYNVSVKEVDGKVLFVRKLLKGGSEHSFGIHVASLAGLPKSIVQRANFILKELEGKGDAQPQISVKQVDKVTQPTQGMQLSLFQLDDPVLSQVRDALLKVDINSLTPLEALNKLSDIRKIVTGKS